MRAGLAAGDQAIRLLIIIAGLLGLGLIVWLIIDAGAADVAQAMLIMGWALVPIALFHVVPLILSTLSWRNMLPANDATGMVVLLGIRWLRESINNLLPVGSIGGDLVGARLVHQSGVPGAAALSSVVVDMTVGLLTQLAFALVGLALLLAHSTEPAVLTTVGGALGGLAIFFGAIILFFVLQNRGLMVFGAKLAGSLMNQARSERLLDNASDVDRTVRSIYRDRRIRKAFGWRILTWFLGAGEIWLIMCALGKPIGVAEAIALESFVVAIRSAAFLIPGAVGVQEGILLLVGSLFGIVPSDSLAISLAKRVREILLGLPGIAVWQAVEGRRLFRRQSR